MSDEQDFYKRIIDNLYDGVYFVDRNRVINYWNKGAERITGYTAQETIGRSCRDNLLNHVTANGIQLCQDHCPLAAVMEDGKERESEVFLHHANGHRLPIMVRATALRDADGTIIGAVESFSNNSTVVNARMKLRQMRQAAATDPLTGIGNRTHLEGRLSAAIAEYQKNGSRAGVLFFDVDHFKNVNDAHGHNCGDRVLGMVANTISHALRAADTVGRWGGEEFIAILYDMKKKNAFRSAAEKLRVLVEHSRLDFDGFGVKVTVSIGGTLVGAKDSPETLVQRADQLLYQSKQAGRNRVTIG